MVRGDGIEDTLKGVSLPHRQHRNAHQHRLAHHLVSQRGRTEEAIGGVCVTAPPSLGTCDRRPSSSLREHASKESPTAARLFLIMRIRGQSRGTKVGWMDSSGGEGGKRSARSNIK